MKEITYEFCEKYITLHDVMNCVKGIILKRMEGSLNEWNKKYLAAEGNDRHVHVEFQREKASTSLYVNTDAFRDITYLRDVTTDDDYAVYNGNDFKVNFSWPSWGSDTIENNAPRIELMQDTMKLAQEIQDYIRKFPKIVSLMSTRAARDDAEKRRLEKEYEFRVRLSMKEVMKGMRVGSERVALFTNVPKGKYESQIGDKKFTAYITEEMQDITTPGATSKGTIIRTA